jgi:hypothetical protein
MPKVLGGKPRVLVLVGGKCVVYQACGVAVVCLVGVQLPMLTMSMLMGRSRAGVHRGAKGRDLRLEVRRIRSGASQDRHGDVVWLDFMVPHRHLVIDVTVTSARMNINVPRIDARLPLPGSVASGA